MHPAKTLLLTVAILICMEASAQTAKRFDVVITEIMADPTPVVGLPNAEYIEIRNVSSTPFNLQGWRLSDAAGTATITSSFVLQPDSMVVLCANSQATAFSAFGRAIGVSSFPSLDNDGELLTLRSSQNKVIHAVVYSNDWYGNEVKKEGGWSLEMLDPTNPCTGKDNWKGSTHPLGGTPGRLNSVNGTNNDTSPPRVINAFAADSLSLVITFNEPLDSATAAVASHYVLPGAAVTSANPMAPLFQLVQLTLNTPLQTGIIATLTISGVADCKGNTIGSYNKAKIGLSQAAAPGDVIVNEILFNPKPGGFDYVELFNRSNKIIDASTLYIANRNSSGTVGSLKKITEDPYFLFPGDYLLLTPDKANLSMQYFVKNEGVVVGLTLPSFPNDKGTVVVLNLSGDIIDEVSYTKEWHFALISNAEGVALERIDPNVPSQNGANWHSAASTVGYGTPSYQNSQHNRTEEIKAMVEISPAVFSPDHDGRDDVAMIHYQVVERGYLANVLIFDAGGRLVRSLARNDLLSLKGFWKWDGLGENMNKLPVGTYVVFTEIFNLDGKKKSFKNTVVLARRIN